jgi:hypothetical protein
MGCWDQVSSGGLSAYLRSEASLQAGTLKRSAAAGMIEAVQFRGV